MARKLGEILVAGRGLSPADLKKALDAQLTFGGRLGTNLLDLGLLDEEALADALREQKRVEIATPRMLETAADDALRLVPAALADRHKAIPFRLEDRRLDVAMLDPEDPIAVDELAFVTGCAIAPYLSPEVQLLAWLERHYGIQRPQRFVRLAAAHDGSGVGPPPQAVEALVVELTRRADEERRREEARHGRATLSSVAAQLSRAEGRDDVGEALVALARTSFARVATWIVQKDRILGWLASVDGLAPESARRLVRAASVGFADPSVLSDVVASRQPFMGELPARAADDRLGDVFGAPRPRSVLMLPVELDGHVVIVLHCDDADRPFGPFDLDALRTACLKAGQAMEVLHLRSRIRQL